MFVQSEHMFEIKSAIGSSCKKNSASDDRSGWALGVDLISIWQTRQIPQRKSCYFQSFVWFGSYAPYLLCLNSNYFGYYCVNWIYSAHRNNVLLHKPYCIFINMLNEFGWIRDG